MKSGCIPARVKEVVEFFAEWVYRKMSFHQERGFLDMDMADEFWKIIVVGPRKAVPEQITT